MNLLKTLLSRHYEELVCIRDNLGLYMSIPKIDKDILTGWEYLQRFGKDIDKYEVVRYEVIKYDKKKSKQDLGYDILIRIIEK